LFSANFMLKSGLTSASLYRPARLFSQAKKFVKFWEHLLTNNAICLAKTRILLSRVLKTLSPCDRGGSLALSNINPVRNLKT
jgi:hypothetical protein